MPRPPIAPPPPASRLRPAFIVSVEAPLPAAAGGNPTPTSLPLPSRPAASSAAELPRDPPLALLFRDAVMTAPADPTFPPRALSTLKLSQPHVKSPVRGYNTQPATLFIPRSAGAL